MEQTYQHVSEIILEELVRLHDSGNTNLNAIRLEGFQGDYQAYFLWKKDEQPEKYERLTYDKNGPVPICDALDEIMFDCLRSGFIDLGKNILINPLKHYLQKTTRKHGG